MKERPDVKLDEFGTKKRKFFSSLAVEFKRALRPHKFHGELWVEASDKKRDWGNVSEHCLIETARVETLAELTKLSEQTTNDLKKAAILHDYDKKHEIETIRKTIAEDSAVLKTLQFAREGAREQLKSLGFNENVISITEAAGGYPETLLRIREILNKEKLTEQDVAVLIMNYVDAYTVNTDWVALAETTSAGPENDIDRKKRYILANPDYSKIERESRVALADVESFQGKSGAEILSDLCHETEKRLAAIIAERSEINMEAVKLPEIIDETIKDKIAGYQ